MYNEYCLYYIHITATRGEIQSLTGLQLPRLDTCVKFTRSSLGSCLPYLPFSNNWIVLTTEIVSQQHEMPAVCKRIQKLRQLQWKLCY